jgi:threonine aldolase
MPAVIDLRSDTVTKPGPAMRQAMMDADVGDDVFGEDPTVNALQEEVAALLGKEAALFVSSGTQANQIALRAHTQPGDEVVAHPMAHIVRAESAGGAALAGVQFRPVGGNDGVLEAAEIEAVYQDGSNPHFAPTRLVCIENTHNFCGGAIWPQDKLQAVADVAKRKKIAVHMDGARLWNAAVAQDVSLAKLASHADSVSLCFSKGLGAPVGSVIVGSKPFIARCLRFRKMYGGGMRQAGILAAAARYALQHHIDRLAEDHANAKLLADGLRQSKYIDLPYGTPPSNMVFFGCSHPKVNLTQLVGSLREKGVLVGQTYSTLARAVCHLDVSRKDIETAIGTVHQILKS